MVQEWYIHICQNLIKLDSSYSIASGCMRSLFDHKKGLVTKRSRNGLKMVRSGGHDYFDRKEVATTCTKSFVIKMVSQTLVSIALAIDCGFFGIKWTQSGRKWS